MPVAAVAVSAVAGAANQLIANRTKRKISQRNQEQRASQFDQSLKLAEKKRRDRARLNDQTAAAKVGVNRIAAARKRDIRNVQLRSKGIAQRSASSGVLDEAIA